MPKITFDYKIPSFKPEVIEDMRSDGYWVEALDISQNGKPDLMTFGVNIGEVFWHRSDDWERFFVTRLVMPVGMAQADVTRNGRMDPFICYEIYGPLGRIEDADPKGGKISWFENPGKSDTKPGDWKQHYVGQSMGMHRIRVGHFTQTKKLELLGFPIALQEVHATVPVEMWTEPDDVLNAKKWTKSLVDGTHFRVIHGVETVEGLVPSSSKDLDAPKLDSVMVSSEAGVHWLHYDVNSCSWKLVHIGEGEKSQFVDTGFKGSGNVDVGRISDDPFAYVATQEPFHGNTVAVYCKDSGAAPQEANWTRYLLDIYGDPNEKGEGPGHQIICADFDGDGDEEFLVALRGPTPWKGVWYYKAVDVRNGLFAKWKVSDESAARIAVADMNGNGKLDFVTIGYKVRDYYMENDAKVIVHYNQM